MHWPQRRIVVRAASIVDVVAMLASHSDLSCHDVVLLDPPHGIRGTLRSLVSRGMTGVCGNRSDYDMFPPLVRQIRSLERAENNEGFLQTLGTVSFAISGVYDILFKLETLSAPDFTIAEMGWEV